MKFKMRVHQTLRTVRYCDIEVEAETTALAMIEAQHLAEVGFFRFHETTIDTLDEHVEVLQNEVRV